MNNFMQENPIEDSTSSKRQTQPLAYEVTKLKTGQKC